jgi:hypothetical protein
MRAQAHTFDRAGNPVRVTVDVCLGLPGFHLVGAGDTRERDTATRIKAALHNSGYEFPCRRITVNLAPINARPGGEETDLAIACALLAASGQCDPAALAHIGLYGALSLDGSLRATERPAALAAHAAANNLAAVIHDTSGEPPASRSGVELLRARDLRGTLQTLGAHQAGVITLRANATVRIAVNTISERVESVSIGWPRHPRAEAGTPRSREQRAITIARAGQWPPSTLEDRGDGWHEPRCGVMLEARHATAVAVACDVLEAHRRELTDPQAARQALRALREIRASWDSVPRPARITVPEPTAL